MARNGRADIFDAEVTFDRRKHQVSQLPEHTDHPAEREQEIDSIQSAVPEQQMSEKTNQQSREQERAHAPRPGLAGTRVGQELASSERTARAIGKDIIQFDGQKDEKEHGSMVPIVGHHPEIAKRIPKQHETEHTQRHALNITLRLVSK